VTATSFFIVDELRRGCRDSARTDRPVLIVDVEFGSYRPEVQVGLPIGGDRAHITPVVVHLTGLNTG